MNMLSLAAPPLLVRARMTFNRLLSSIEARIASTGAWLATANGPDCRVTLQSKNQTTMKPISRQQRSRKTTAGKPGRQNLKTEQAAKGVIPHAH
jgi:hypothetical protein